MSENLSGKTALITGAGRRIGRETALALAREGVNVVIHYRRSGGKADELAAEIEQFGVKVWTVAADFSVATERESLIVRTVEAAGSLDILINNASEFPTDSIDNISLGDLELNLEVNAWAPFVLIRDFAEKLGKGKIVNMLDSRTSGYDWTHVGYILSKHVISVLTSMCALRYAPDITINGVAPGLILPPPGKDESYLEKLADTVPLKMHGDPRDIAETVLFLLKSNFITGEVIYVDGGRHLKEYSPGPKGSTSSG